jgi:hypothetical protein
VSLISIRGFDLTAFHKCLSPRSAKQRSLEFGLSTKYTRADTDVTQQQASSLHIEPFAIRTEDFADNLEVKDDQRVYRYESDRRSDNLPIARKWANIKLTIQDYLRHSNLHVTNKYLQATSKTKRLAQDKLVDAILPTGILPKNLIQRMLFVSVSDGNILVRRLSSPNIP